MSKFTRCTQWAATAVCLCTVLSAHADIYVAARAYASRDYKTSLREFEVPARNGNSLAQSLLGVQYERGEGTPPNLTRAAEWYRKASAKGDSRSSERLANLYAFGLGVKTDVELALDLAMLSTIQGGYAAFDRRDDKAGQVLQGRLLELRDKYTRLAEQGNGRAQLRLGYMYLLSMVKEGEPASGEKAQSKVDFSSILAETQKSGREMERQRTRGVAWLESAARQGDADAQFLLGFVSLIPWNGPPEFDKGFKWYEMAAKQGLASAQLNLALMYLGSTYVKASAGQSVPIDKGKALVWAQKSSAQGNANGQYLYAALLAERGAAGDLQTGIALLKKASDQGNTSSMILLGDLYATGKGFSPDDGKAIVWYRNATDLGERSGYLRLGRMYEDGRGVPKDLFQAVQYYELGLDSDMSDQAAQLNLKLARMYEDGIGVEKDGDKAVQRYARAGLGGSLEAMKRLEEVYSKGQLGQKPDDVKVKHWREAQSKAKGSS
jgi:TPR repeat protein